MDNLLHYVAVRKMNRIIDHDFCSTALNYRHDMNDWYFEVLWCKACVSSSHRRHKMCAMWHRRSLTNIDAGDVFCLRASKQWLHEELTRRQSDRQKHISMHCNQMALKLYRIQQLYIGPISGDISHHTVIWSVIRKDVLRWLSLCELHADVYLTYCTRRLSTTRES